MYKILFCCCCLSLLCLFIEIASSLVLFLYGNYCPCGSLSSLIRIFTYVHIYVCLYFHTILSLFRKSVRIMPSMLAYIVIQAQSTNSLAGFDVNKTGDARIGLVGTKESSYEVFCFFRVVFSVLQFAVQVFHLLANLRCSTS